MTANENATPDQPIDVIAAGNIAGVTGKVSVTINEQAVTTSFVGGKARVPIAVAAKLLLAEQATPAEQADTETVQAFIDAAVQRATPIDNPDHDVRFALKSLANLQTKSPSPQNYPLKFNGAGEVNCPSRVAARMIEVFPEAKITSLTPEPAEVAEAPVAVKAEVAPEAKTEPVAVDTTDELKRDLAARVNPDVATALTVQGRPQGASKGGASKGGAK